MVDMDIVVVKFVEKNFDLKVNEEVFDKECGVGKCNSFGYIMFFNMVLFRY